MAKQINLEFEGKKYCLEYSRRTVEQLERQGFSIADIERKPMLTLPTLFAGAFLKNHRKVKMDTIDRIFEKIANKSDLLNKLAEMYNEPLETLLDESEDTEGNVDWGTSW